jgi:hypothetical protein
MVDRTIIAVIAIAAIGAAACAYNTANSTEEVTGDKYASTYSKCAQWQPGPKGIQSCGRWEPAVEYRVNTQVKGPLFTYESYKVVAK